MVATTCFLVLSGYKFGLAQTHFSHPDWVCTDWFRQFTASQPFQSFHHEYVEWLDMVEIGIHPPQPSPHPNFLVEGGAIFRWGGPHVSHQVWAYTDLFSKFIISSTHPISHYKYNEWLDKVEIDVWALKWSPPCVFQSRVGSKLAYLFSTFDTKIQWVLTDWGNSQHLNPSNIS